MIVVLAIDVDVSISLLTLYTRFATLEKSETQRTQWAEVSTLLFLYPLPSLVLSSHLNFSRFLTLFVHSPFRSLIG